MAFRLIRKIGKVDMDHAGRELTLEGVKETKMVVKILKAFILVRWCVLSNWANHFKVFSKKELRTYRLDGFLGYFRILCCRFKYDQSLWGHTVLWDMNLIL
jgi:hypothetical protein